MNRLGHSHSSAQDIADLTPAERRQRRKERLMAILTVGLPTISAHIFELNTLLSAPSVELRKVARIIRADPSMSAQLLRMCNSALFGLRRRVLSIEEASVLMGTERLRTLVLTCSVMEFTNKQLPDEQVQEFWQHSFMTGMLSERIAKWIEYSQHEQAYLGGLLHDVGLLPLLVVATEEKDLETDPPVKIRGGSLEDEKAHFGLNHCEVGRSIGTSWNFFPSFIDIFEHHHHPENSSRDPHLVGIVAAADHFSETHTLASDPALPEPPELASDDDFFAVCFPRLDAEDRAELIEMLENEYLHLLPLIEFNNPSLPKPDSKPARI